MKRLEGPASAGPDALDRLTLLGEAGGLIAILAGVVLSFFLLGYFAVYWRHADMDFMVVYNALLLNDGGAQQFLDHPAWLTIEMVRGWFSLLHAFGLLDAWTLSAIPPASSPAFDIAMTHAVRAARLASLFTAIGLILIFWLLVRRILHDWRIALLATFVFAFSGGIAVHVRILRSELLSAGLVLVALMLLMLAARRPGPFRPLVIAEAAALCMLGLENKVQAILLIAAFPVLLLPFGTRIDGAGTFWRRPAAWLAALAAAVAAVLAVRAAQPLVAYALDPATLSSAGLKPVLAGHAGLAQALIAVWLVAGMLAWAALWKAGAAETVTAVCAAIAGGALVLLLLDLQFNPGVVVAIINPLEKMLSFGDAATAEAAGGIGNLIRTLAQGIAQVLMRLTFVLFSSPRPTVFLTWLIIPGIVLAWVRGHRQVAMQAFVMLAVAIGIDSLAVRRGLKSEYFIYTDPLIILAGALLLDAMPHLARLRFAYPIGVALFVAHIGVSQAEPVRHLLKRSGPENICEWSTSYLPRLPLPWCASPQPRP